MTKGAKLWIKALRSGTYRQAKTVLEDASGALCCLGVACKVYEQHHKRKLSKTLIDRIENLESFPEVAKWLGLRSVDAMAPNYLSLAEMNDDGASFQHIADFIESDPPGLFK